ncbi:MAG: sulfatase [Sedimentisphaeraceae bacterium JB056]
MRILYLDIDTLRPDHLGCYGYHRNTSPNIDRIAEEGVRFNNYYCSDAPCLPSRSALMSSMYGIHTGAIGHGGTSADFRLQGESRGFRSDWDLQSLPQIYRNAGMHTAIISPFAERHSSFTYYAGFNEMHNTGKCGSESAEEISPVVLDWLDRNAQSDNWYLHVNYWDPHTPYRAPADFGNPFNEDPLPDWFTPEVLEHHNKHVGPHSSLETGMYNGDDNAEYPRQPGTVKTMERLKEFVDGYDCGVRYMDEHVGGILSMLEDKGVLDDTVIIVSSDHGENIGELGLYAEHGTADNITCRIPMIIRWPGRVKAGEVDGLHLNIDLAPTMADMLNQPPHPNWEGRSFSQTLTDGEDTGYDDIVISQCAHVCQRSVRWDDWLYMRTYHDGYHLFPQEMLYNIKEDPHEQNDLASRHPELCREGVWRLMKWHDEMMATQPFGYTEDPMWTVISEGGPFHAKGHLHDYCNRLEATGRGWAVPILKQRHPYEFPNSTSNC